MTMQDNAKETFEFDPKKLLKVEIDKVRENSWNPKSRDTKEYKDVKRSIEINGLTQPIFVRENNNGESEYEVLDGAHRLRACKELGYKEIYIYNEGDVADELAKSFTIFHQVQVPFDKKLLEPLVIELNEVGIELPDMGIQLELSNNDVIEDDEFVAEIDETEEPKSRLGEVYQLGQHRLMCGDSTDAGSVAILMDGNKADMVFTDPPYGVSYTGGLQFKDGYVKKNNREMIKNDDVDIYGGVFAILGKFTQGPCYVWFSDSKIKSVYDAAEKYGDVHALLIWVKNGGYGTLNANYKQKHEPCLYWCPKGRKLNFCGKSTESTIWEIDKDGINNYHPTQKPVALSAKAINNHSCKTVLDLFGGSGSTLIACEQLGRKCYMMELDPKYCDVIRKRYWAFTHDGDETGWEEGTSCINDSESVV